MSSVNQMSLGVQFMTELLTQPYRRGGESLALSLGQDTSTGTNVADYDFREYKARYGLDPQEPKYILFLKSNAGRDPVDIEVDFLFQGGQQATSFRIPAGSLVGASFAIPLPDPRADATSRLLRFRQKPVALPGAGADNFGIISLLGNLAKFAWAISWEKDLIRSHMRDVQQQRQRDLAHGFSLDKLGEDLRVPRFPPREYSFDQNTIGLYHLNDFVKDQDPVVDETSKFGVPGHSGVNQSAQSLAIGKFGNGFLFPRQGTPAITITTSTDFDIAANKSFTVEMFVNADPIDDPAIRLLAIKGNVDQGGTLTGSGWSLSIASVRGMSNNVRWSVSDGNHFFEIFADVNIADGKFHHIGGVLDRTRQRARLFVDGEERSSVDISLLGVVSNVRDIRIGSSAVGHPLGGVVDEIRFSNLGRTDFHPVLGEGDDAYRKRLGIFEHWLLPEPDALLTTINDLVQINNDPKSFVLVELPPSSATASKTVRIVPASLPVGGQIDRDGNALSKEVDVSGRPEEDSDFEPLFLFTHNRPGVDYGLDPDNARMQRATKDALDVLLDLLAAANPPVVGNLVITKSFDPAATDLHKVGRALKMSHQNLPLDPLGVFAHRAGFDFVENNGAHIHASVAPAEKLQIDIEPRLANQTPPAGIDVFLTKTINTDLAPAPLPAAGLIRWTLISCGVGQAHFVAHPADDPNLRTPVTSRPRLQLVADAPGEITIRVEYTLHGRVYSGTRTIRISIESLDDQSSISANGDRQISEQNAVGELGEIINPIYLITSNVAGVSYGADPNNKKMQIVLEKAFDVLLQRNPGLANGLQVLKAFDPQATDLHRAARALLLSHNTINAGALAALAHQSGFGFVIRQGAQIYCSAAAGDRIEVVHANTPAPLEDELVVGTPVDLRVRFDPLPGVGSFNWNFATLGFGDGSFDFVLRPQVRFTPRHTGAGALVVTYLEQDPSRVSPYSFEIRLNPQLEAANAIIPKDLYDLIMNILNYFHPIGVEVATANIRKHVVEVEQDPKKAFPAYTYPDFRI